MFDVPPQDKCRLSWQGNMPLDERDWNVGMIVGPSGCGKSTVARHAFKDAFHVEMQWQSKSVIDDVSASCSVEKISDAFSSVGFNTIPAWLRPYAVLSNGEKFRVDLARRLLELPDPIVVDEFSSVVDRQVAQIGAHAVQKHVRANKRKFVAVTCHYDVLEWLQPDWVLEPATMTFQWRLLRRRPELDIEIVRVKYAMWKLFAPFHYLTAELAKSASCFCLFIDKKPAAFTGILHFPHPTVSDLKTCSRLVTLPDWQGLGLAFVLIDKIAAAYKACNWRLRTYPAHPSFVRSFARSDKWVCKKKSGEFQARAGRSGRGISKQRPCAVFEYIGAAADAIESQKLIHG